MVVTKYAPPPGYNAQSAPRPSSQQQGWSSAPQQYAHGYPQPSYAGYPPQPYAAAGAASSHYGQSYQQQVSPPIGSYTPSVDGGSFPTPTGSHPATFEYLQQSPPTTIAAVHGRHSSVSDIYGSSNASYFPPGALHSRTKSSQGYAPSIARHNSAPSVAYDYAAAYARQEAGEYIPGYASAPLEDILEVLEAEYDEECYYFNHPEEIDKDRSIGWIESHTALPTSRPLPATFNEAELEALAPRPQKSPLEDCISEYFNTDAREEQLNTVRLSPSWSDVKDDLIFKEFLQIGYETIRRDLMEQKYRNRVDANWDRFDSASISHFARASIETVGAQDIEQRRNSRPHTRNASRSARRESVDAPYHREQSLADGGRRNSQGPTNRPSSAASNHSRASSVCSRYSTQRPKALEPIRDQTQDDILAKLGVTGSPRLVYETPGPAFGPPASVHSSRQSSVTSEHQFAPTSRAPSEPQQFSQPVGFNDPWSGHGKPQYRQDSGAGRYDLTSSEFTIMEDPDATPRPKNNRSHGLKRHHDGDHHHNDNREKRVRDNEATPKQNRKQNRPADGSVRRW